METLKAYKYRPGGSLQILDILQLPIKEHYDTINSVDDCYCAIKEMKVRGAPLVAVVGALSLAVELYKKEFESTQQLSEFIDERLNHLCEARLVHTNMKKAFEDIKNRMEALLLQQTQVAKAAKDIISVIEGMADEEDTANRTLAVIGANHILEINCHSRQTVLTHSNTGALATSGFGTAYGIIRVLAERQILEHVFYTETRPHHDGSRLTAYELHQSEISSTLVTDSAAAFVMKLKKITVVIVGANRVTANGDTTNKIGTYQLAISARHHHIPFFVCATSNTIDVSIDEGQEFKVEERPSGELTQLRHTRLCPEGTHVWNPAYDVTPASLITGIITEKGVFRPGEIRNAFG